ncbi:MAG TPA: NUDIX hydrolase [Pyrinomonadaceae bacterium]|jgi:ADP-ribose pyrophosphatase YjhB (NUDIX family)
MWHKLFAALWRRAPRRVRRAGVWLWEPRFTVTAGACVLDERGRVLLLKHRFRGGTGWGIPGGFLEKGEQPEAALRRELREEVGLELTAARVAFVRTLARPRQVEILFCARAAAGAPRPRGGEIERAEWYAPDALPAALPADQHRLIERALQSSANPPD